MERNQTTSSKRVGRWISITVSGLVALNGVGWFFVGPSLSTFEQDTGISLMEFTRAFPEAAQLVALQTRNTAILLMGLGMLGVTATRTTQHTKLRSARLAGWVFGLTLIGVGLSELLSGAVFGAAYLTLGALALVGHLLALRS